MMNQGQRVISMAALAGLLGALVLAGCATKNVAVTTAGNPTTPGQAETKAAGNAPLKGFSKNPVEEQVTQPAPMVMAKAEQPTSQVRKGSEVESHRLADIYFAFDSWGLSQEGRKYLVEDAETLKQHPEAKLVIEGYCDERGSHEYNLVLGEKRAQEATRYLETLGIKNHVKVISYGKERQVCTEQDESCYWKNRKAHLLIESGK